MTIGELKAKIAGMEDSMPVLVPDQNWNTWHVAAAHTYQLAKGSDAMYVPDAFLGATVISALVIEREESR